MPKLEMSEIEIFSTVVIFISAIGIVLVFFWQYRRLRREVLEERETPHGHTGNASPSGPRKDNRSTWDLTSDLLPHIMRVPKTHP